MTWENAIKGGNIIKSYETMHNVDRMAGEKFFSDFAFLEPSIIYKNWLVRDLGWTIGSSCSHKHIINLWNSLEDVMGGQ